MRGRRAGWVRSLALGAALALAAAAVAILAVRADHVLASALAVAVVMAILAVTVEPAELGALVPDAPMAASLATSAAIFPHPIITIDRRSVVVEVNEAAQAILPGLRARQPLAFALRDPEVLEAIPKVAATGEPLVAEIGGRTSSEAQYEVRIRSLTTPGSAPALGEPVVALFLRDVSAERRLERMRVDFIANVSHELRTPLASLSGFIDTLQGAARDDVPARERFLKIMQAQAARMTRLIDDLLQLSRVELKEHLPPDAPVDLAATVAHMVEVMAPMARERGVAIALDLPAEPAGVLGDRDELLRLVENLVENAIKYGGSGGPVEVAVTPELEGSRVELMVRDHGPGIGREHLPRLTERFYRVDVADSRAQGGTGLGLAIVKHIAGRHRARLSIDSEAGQGATFRVSFPARPPR